MGKIIIGDALESLRLIESNLVDCCVTSPPYFGLRDYGTGQWEGGNSDCDHLQSSGQRQDVGRFQVNGFHGSALVSDLRKKSFSKVCSKCGAIRIDKQIGLEETPESYVEKLVEVFHEVKRVLKNDGTLWLNIGDSYFNYRPGKGQSLSKQTMSNSKQDLPETCPRRNFKTEGIKEKDLIGIPWLLAFALRADGWYLRQDIIWQKPCCMPEAVKDRCTKSHEYIFLLSKSQNYYFDYKAIQEPAITPPSIINKNEEGYQADYPKGPRFSEGERIYGADGMRNKRDVWTISSKPYKEAHFAVFPAELIRPCIRAGSRKGGIVLDPFIGSGTTAMVALEESRDYIGIELNPKYLKLINERKLDAEQNQNELY